MNEVGEEEVPKHQPCMITFSEDPSTVGLTALDFQREVQSVQSWGLISEQSGLGHQQGH